MKVTVNVDCTPEEARAFLGLPDLAPLHAAYLERMQGFITDGMQPEDVQKLFRAWMPGLGDGVQQWQQAFWNAATGGKG
jgi:hypothetical protein